MGIKINCGPNSSDKGNACPEREECKACPERAEYERIIAAYERRLTNLSRDKSRLEEVNKALERAMALAEKIAKGK